MAIRTPDKLTVAHIADAAKIESLLYRTQNLTDEAFQDLVDDVGARLARLVLRAKAVSGDIKALELYDKIVTRDREKRDKQRKPRVVGKQSSTFEQPPRLSDESTGESTGSGESE